MSKIKPFVWEPWPVSASIYTSTPFGKYVITEFSTASKRFSLTGFGGLSDKFETLEVAKRFAFDDFKRRLEETLGESVGYDLPIDENC